MDGNARQVFRQRRPIVFGLPGHVEQAAEEGVTDGNGDRSSARAHRQAASQARGRLQRDATNDVFVEMCLNLDR